MQCLLFISLQTDICQFIALYNHTAADDDEVTFEEDDIFQGTIIDEGWLEGMVLCTGHKGMAPRNYFEKTTDLCRAHVSIFSSSYNKDYSR